MVRVFVAGGTGVIGRSLVPQLVERGHQVTATTTGGAGLGLLAQLGADGMVMDGLDAAAVGEAVAAARPDVVVKAGGVALRYGGLYGRGAGDDQVRLVRKRLFPLVGGGTGWLSWVHVDDAASATVLAIEQRATGVFDIVDDEPAPVSQWLPYLAECTGARPPRRVPAGLARLLAGPLAVAMMTEARAFANTKAKRELGWQLRYPSWRQGFRAEFA